VALALAGLEACRGAVKTGQGQAAGIPVKIQTAEATTIDDATEYVATLKSRDSAVIMPQVEGQITRILVRSGDRVSAGTPLMQIDPAKQQAAVKSQEDTRAAKVADLEYVRQQYERVSGLHAAGVSSQHDLDQAKAALEAAQAEVQALDARVREQQVELLYHRVVAPRDGIVGDIPVRIGDRVTVSTALTTVDKPGSLEAYVSVPVERAAQLHVGAPVQIVDSSGQEIATSRIGFISPQVDDQTQTVLVKATIQNDGRTLRTAQLIRARIIWGRHEGLLVPLLAVSRISGSHFAFVAEDQKGSLVARQRQLRVGEIVGNDYVVLDGLKSGDRIIVSGTQFLADGVPVSPQT
jgi:RND family efflux transporter MFP subunit